MAIPGNLFCQKHWNPLHDMIIIYKCKTLQTVSSFVGSDHVIDGKPVPDSHTCKTRVLFISLAIGLHMQGTKIPLVRS